MGSCPTNTTEFDLTVDGYDDIKCVGDWYCPPGFKCCPEDTAKPYHICKKAILEVEKKKTNGKNHNDIKNGNGNDNKNGNGPTITPPPTTAPPPTSPRPNVVW